MIITSMCLVLLASACSCLSSISSSPSPAGREVPKPFPGSSASTSAKDLQTLNYITPSLLTPPRRQVSWFRLVVKSAGSCLIRSPLMMISGHGITLLTGPFTLPSTLSHTCARPGAGSAYWPSNDSMGQPHLS